MTASVRRHPRKRCPYCGHPLLRETDKTCAACDDLPLLDNDDLPLLDKVYPYRSNISRMVGTRSR